MPAPISRVGQFVQFRHCGKCGQSKPLSEFSRSKNKSSWCRSCCAESARVWRQANLEKARQYDRDRQGRQQTSKAREWQRFYRWLSRHALRPEDYHELFELQGGRCAICRQFAEKGKFLHIDHDHACCPGDKSCGKCVRGLLCPSCNVGLGHFRDNAELLLAAMHYLKAGA